VVPDKLKDNNLRSGMNGTRFEAIGSGVEGRTIGTTNFGLGDRLIGGVSTSPSAIKICQSTLLLRGKRETGACRIVS
jgi:hypothetical protein